MGYGIVEGRGWVCAGQATPPSEWRREDGVVVGGAGRGRKGEAI